jgi:hypothetical protein
MRSVHLKRERSKCSLFRFAPEKLFARMVVVAHKLRRLAEQATLVKINKPNWNFILVVEFRELRPSHFHVRNNAGKNAFSVQQSSK